MNKVKHMIIAAILISFLFAGTSLTEGAISKKKNGSAHISKSVAKRNSGMRPSTKAKAGYSKSRNSGKSFFRNNGAVPQNRNTSFTVSKANPNTKVLNKPSMKKKTLKAEKNQPLTRTDTKNKQQKMRESGTAQSSKEMEKGLQEGLKKGLKYGLKYGLKEGEKK